ncbi:unnamed protein product [Ranitomeya imitator]|uniref:Uncharacterized protein n=1 Tax=Ranitomeya imitator TaxID=111125 RepID=A0ABN9L9R4_9NEOB|nr:unnamed protein product [Ranitomeya imitator]
MLHRCLPQVSEFSQPPLFSYKRSRTIASTLVRSNVGSFKKSNQLTFTGQTRKSCFPCLSCVNCCLILKGSCFTHPVTNEVFKICHFLTCDSEYVIYLLTRMSMSFMTSCDFKTRINQHRHPIRKKRMDLPVSKHFSKKNHTEKKLRFCIIDTIPVQRRGGDRLRMLKRRELEWIMKLNTLKPHGLNVDFKCMPPYEATSS